MRLLLYEVSFRLYRCTNDYVDNLLIGSRIELYAHACVYTTQQSQHITAVAQAPAGKGQIFSNSQVRRSSAIYNRQCTIKTIPRL